MHDAFRPALAAFLTTVLTFGITGSARAQEPCAQSDLRPVAAEIGAYEAAVVCLINHERVMRDRARLDVRPRLTAAAERHARDMVQRGYFSHVSPAGNDMVDRLRRVGYLPRDGAWTAGEILSWGVLWRSTPEATVAAWLDSPPHRAAMLDPRFTEIGAGAALGNPRGLAAPGVTVAVEFGDVEGRGAERYAAPPR